MSKDKGTNFLLALINDYNDSTPSGKLGIISSIFTITGVSGIYLYSNIAITNFLNLKLAAVPPIILLTSILCGIMLLLIGIAVWCTSSRFYEVPFIRFIASIFVWGITLFLISTLLGFYIQFVQKVLNVYSKI